MSEWKYESPWGVDYTIVEKGDRYEIYVKDRFIQEVESREEAVEILLRDKRKVLDMWYEGG